MITYKFEQFNSEITDPTITIKSVTDNVSEKNCSVEVLLDNSVSKFGIQLHGFDYRATNTWDDSIILNWAKNELEKFII